MRSGHGGEAGALRRAMSVVAVCIMHVHIRRFLLLLLLERFFIAGMPMLMRHVTGMAFERVQGFLSAIPLG